MIFIFVGDYGISFDEKENLFHNIIDKDKNVLVKLVDDDIMYYICNFIFNDG